MTWYIGPNAQPGRSDDAEGQYIKTVGLPKLVIPWHSPWKKRLPANRRRILDAVAAGSQTAPNWIPGWERYQEETLF